MIECNLKFPEKYIDKAVYRYKMDMQDFIYHINATVTKYKQKFKLKNIELVEPLSINVVLKADSEEFGKVILKIGVPDSIKYEIDFIRKSKSRYLVQCYYYNYEEGIILLKKIEPGCSLNTIKSIDERLKIISKIVDDILLVPDCKNNNCKRYSKMFSIKVSDPEIYNKLDEQAQEMLQNAKEYYREIEEMNLKEYILHRDLHYENILKDEQLWQVIDPHGVVGYRVFETAQIIKSELKLVNNDVSNLENIILKVSLYLKEDINLIYKSLYVDTVTKILFYVSNGHNQSDIDYQKNICDFIINKIVKN